ncbi:MAG: NAD(P)/FAD-dependent oxidoreductase [Clostridia bacterium]|nr:NAD(P)/FAD-dependent oxidoreductase [Clostridia bacterium]
MNDRYKVVIIGAGPAGIGCALNLLDRGEKDILVAETYKFPRDKCCAGYITKKTKKEYEKLGLEPEKCGYSLIKDFRLFRKLRPKQKIENKFLFTNRKINRVELDNAFFELAVRKGIEVAQNARLESHDGIGKTVTFEDGRKVGYEFLVFADGTSGFSGRYQKAKKKNIAMQLIFPDDAPESIEIHFGLSPRGYVWVSSKDGFTNVGLTDVFVKKRDYSKLFGEVLEKVGKSPDTKGLYAAFTPIGVKKSVMDGCVYFVGDALGACDPLTLSGLRYALRSSAAASDAISKNDPGIMKRFALKLKLKFALTSFLLKVFYTAPMQFLVFEVGCRFFGGIVIFFFNRFLNKK